MQCAAVTSIKFNNTKTICSPVKHKTNIYPRGAIKDTFYHYNFN